MTKIGTLFPGEYRKYRIIGFLTVKTEKTAERCMIPKFFVKLQKSTCGMWYNSRGCDKMHLYMDRGKYGHNTLYVSKTFRKENGKTTIRIIEKLGRYDDLLKEHEDPISWAKEYVEKLNEEEKRQKSKPKLSYYENGIFCKTGFPAPGRQNICPFYNLLHISYAFQNFWKSFRS